MNQNSQMNLRRGLMLLALAWCFCRPTSAVGATAEQYLKQPDAWFQTVEARRLATNILTWQAPAGDWPKNGDTVSKPYSGDTNKLQGTFDNSATTGEIRFLARAVKATRDAACHAAVLKGIDHILEAQYPTGGWPQYSPPPTNSYHRHITFNDNAMVRLLEILREVATSASFDFVDLPRRNLAQKAFDRGVACILTCQIKVNGKLAVWCAQHDEKDFTPAAGRAYELVSLSGSESAGILHFLMTLDHPSPEVMGSVQAGVDWFDSSKIVGIRETVVEGNKVIVPDTNAPPLWARFYEIPTGRPFFSGRDGVRKYSLAEIEAERRNGYSWYGSWGKRVAADYADWSKKWLKPASKTP
jgi:PelA/Pel-15E family pectate lyase